MVRKKLKHSKIDMMDVVVFLVITLVNVLMLYPLINVLAVSLSSYTAYVKNPMMIWPSQFTMAAYREIMKNSIIWNAYSNTIIVTVAGTLISLFLYVTMAFPLSKRQLAGRGVFMKLIVFTMLFNGGLIPNFLVVKQLGLYDTLSALILPMAFSAFNLILIKNFFEALPESLLEAAKIDGANDFLILRRIVLPLSLPIISTIGLFSAVGYWNSYFNAVVYTKSYDNWTLQLLLREIIMGASMDELASGGNIAESGVDSVTESIKYAALVIAILPILCVYPFLQKYFVSGVMVGAVKG